MICKTNLKTSGMLVLIFTILVGCAAKKPFWGDPETGFILKYRITPDQVWKYHTNSKQNTSMEMMGQSMDTEADVTNIYSLKGTGLDDQKNLLTTVTIDTMNMIVSSVQGEKTFDLTPLMGKSFGLTVSPKGGELEFSGIDSLPQIDFGQAGGREQSAKSFFRNLFPNLPQNPIKVGETWTDKKEFTEAQGNLEVTVNTEATNVLEGFEIVDGTECLKIKTQTTGTLDGSGQQMGADMAFEGDLESTATWYFAYKRGVFVKMTSEQFMEATIAVSGPTTMTIPMTQETRVDVQLAP